MRLAGVVKESTPKEVVVATEPFLERPFTVDMDEAEASEMDSLSEIGDEVSMDASKNSSRGGRAGDAFGGVCEFMTGEGRGEMIDGGAGRASMMVISVSSRSQVASGGGRWAGVMTSDNKVFSLFFF